MDDLHARLRTILIGPTTQGHSREAISIPICALTATLQLELETEGPVIAVAGMFPGSVMEDESVRQAALGELRDATMLLIELVRWRLDPGSWAGDRISGGGSYLEWSADGNEWTILSDTTERELELVPSSVVLSAESEQWLADTIESGAREPLGREIWHTALGAHLKREYRTAVVLAVNAVEVGLKQFIASVIPQSEWFVMNAQSPSISRMLKEYLPELPGVDKDHLPDSKLRSIIHKAVERRNKMIHVGIDASSVITVPDKDESTRVLGAASDVLWLLDYYQGHEWALSRVGWADRQSLDYWFAPWKMARKQ